MELQNQLTYAQGVFVQTKLPELFNYDLCKLFKIKKRFLTLFYFILFFHFFILTLRLKPHHFRWDKLIFFFSN